MRAVDSAVLSLMTRCQQCCDRLWCDLRATLLLRWTALLSLTARLDSSVVTGYGVAVGLSYFAGRAPRDISLRTGWE